MNECGDREGGASAHDDLGLEKVEPARSRRSILCRSRRRVGLDERAKALPAAIGVDVSNVLTRKGATARLISLHPRDPSTGTHFL